MDANMKHILEGQLSKYTNVMKGWQYRWFVLNPETGTLTYFMVDEQRSSRPRGSIHLAGAVVCPSDEDSHTFSVNSAGGELYRLRASDARQRQHWVDRLRSVIEMFNRVQAETQSTPPPQGDALALSASPRQYEAPLSVLSSLHDASAALQQTAGRHGQLSAAIGELPSHVSEDVTVTSTDSELLLLKATSQATLLCLEQCYAILQQQRSAAALPIGHPLPAAGGADRGSGSLRLGATRARPEKDFLSDVADWFDTNFGTTKTPRRLSEGQGSPRPSASVQQLQQTPPPKPARAAPAAPAASGLPSSEADVEAEEGAEADGEEEEEEEAAAAESAAAAAAVSALRPLLATLKLGADLTRLRLPAALLEPRSLLERYSELWARPDSFTRIGRAGSPAARMCRLLEWYVPALGAGCPRDGKPYNPVLGEVFACSWPAADGRGQLRFLAEQVSHHPPVSALCVSCSEPAMSLQATVGCRAQYVNSASVSLTGEATLYLPDVGETYTLNYPALYARSLLSDGWVEMGGQVKISCQQTGYSASATFHTKPLSDEGERHRVTGEVRAPDGQLVLRLAGNWDRQIQLLGQQGEEPYTVPCGPGSGSRRRVRPVTAQGEHESRRVWAAVTSALLAGQPDAADEQKLAVEEAQRQRAGHGHTPRHFYQHETSWVFRDPAA